MPLHAITSTFAGFERRDWLTLFASSAALSISLLTFVQRSRAGHMALRKQLTDLLQKLTDLTLQADTYRALEGKPRFEEFPRNYLTLLNDQRRFLVRQAEFIAREIGALVSPYEYLLIAGAFTAVDDATQAERYYRKAVASAGTPLDRGIALRQHAHFLGRHGRTDEARAQYARAIAAVSGDTDDSRIYRTRTYARWARAAAEWGEPQEAETNLTAAQAACDSIVNTRRRDHEQAGLAALQATRPSLTTEVSDA